MTRSRERTTVRVRGGAGTTGSPCGPRRRGPRGCGGRSCGAPDAAVVVVRAALGLGLGADRPPDEPQQRDERDLQHDHDPEEAPHLLSVPGRTPVSVIRTSSPGAQGLGMDHIKLEQLDADGAIRETAEAAGVDRADFLKKGRLGGAGFVAGGVLFNGLASPAAAAISTSRKSLAQRRQDRQLRADPRVPRGRVLPPGGRATSAFSNAALPRSFAEITGDHEAAHVKALKRHPRLRGRQEADVRLRRRRHRSGDVRRDRQVARGHGRRRLRGPGPEHQDAVDRQGRAVDPLGRGAPRGVDPLPQPRRRRRRRATCPAPAGVRPGRRREAPSLARSSRRRASSRASDA